MSNISNRKDDHIRLALDQNHQAQLGCGLERLTFEHIALPQLALSDIDTSSEFLGHRVSAPFIIGAMTGGSVNGERINQNLAEAAEYCHIPMAVGSKRAALEQKLDQNVRHWAPRATILVNLGATQLQQSGTDLAKRAVDSISADALIIHVNPLQELIQPNGDRDWTRVLEAIHDCVNNLAVPVIIKEVGAGIGPSTAKMLADAGVTWIEIAGRGGTSWPSIELARNNSTKEQQVAEPFIDWGMDTADLITTVHSTCPDINLIGSGGVRNGLDIAKCIRLGAQMAALAQPFLSSALESSDAIIEKIEIIQEQLRWAMFLTGSKDLQALRSAPLTQARL
jgi:isopentenyl-diphosphate delta-isomerase